MTIRNYMAEIRYVFAYYNHLNPEQLTQDHIVSYINYIKKEHGVGRDKCRMTAQSCSFFFKHILPSPYVVPHALYPRKEFRLPEILTQDQISHVIQSTTNIKHKAIIALFYGTGIRLSELRFLEMKHISRSEMQLKVVAGKGSRDRFTILPSAILPLLEAYYRVHRPKVFLFEGQIPGKAMNDRSIQHAIRMAMNQAGFEQYGFSAHSIRHSFATHLLDAGTDIHTIKQLLGHSKIETTMIYLHLTKQRRDKLVSPLDLLGDEK